MKREKEKKYIASVKAYLEKHELYPDLIYCEHLDMADGFIVRAVFEWGDRESVHQRYSQLIHTWAKKNRFDVVCPDYIVGEHTPTRSFTAEHHVGLKYVG